MDRRGTSPKRNVADPGSIPGASKGEVAELADAKPYENRLKADGSKETKSATGSNPVLSKSRKIGRLAA